jgi:hypothetical protein
MSLDAVLCASTGSDLAVLEVSIEQTAPTAPASWQPRRLVGGRWHELCNARSN